MKIGVLIALIALGLLVKKYGNPQQTPEHISSVAAIYHSFPIDLQQRFAASVARVYVVGALHPDNPIKYNAVAYAKGKTVWIHAGALSLPPFAASTLIHEMVHAETPDEIDTEENAYLTTIELTKYDPEVNRFAIKSYQDWQENRKLDDILKAYFERQKGAIVK